MIHILFYIFLALFACSLFGLLVVSGYHVARPDKHTVKTETIHLIFSIATFVLFVVALVTGLAAFT